MLNHPGSPENPGIQGGGLALGLWKICNPSLICSLGMPIGLIRARDAPLADVLHAAVISPNRGQLDIATVFPHVATHEYSTALTSDHASFLKIPRSIDRPLSFSTDSRRTLGGPSGNRSG